MHEETIANIITWGVTGGFLVGAAMGLEVNTSPFNPGRGCEMAIASVSAGTLTCGEKTWAVVGSKFTPKGTFPIEPAEVRTDIRYDRLPSPDTPVQAIQPVGNTKRQSLLRII